MNKENNINNENLLNEEKNITSNKENLLEDSHLLLENKIKDLEEKCKNTENALEKSNQSFLYLKADLENIKRNSYKEIEASTFKSSEKIILNFISILDDFELCIENEKKNNKDLPEGFNLIYKSFLKVFENLNIKEVDTKSFFDSSLHEAITFITEEQSKLEKNKIFSVIKKGYLYKGKLIRPAQVIVVS